LLTRKAFVDNGMKRGTRKDKRDLKHILSTRGMH